MLNNAPKSAEVIIDVPFFDVDAMQVVWHGHYVKYLEVARCELLRSFHYDYNEMSESGYMWPIVDMSLKYVGSALFAHKIKVTATLKEWENESVSCVSDGSGALFCEAFFALQKKRERIARPVVFTEGHAQNKNLMLLKLRFVSDFIFDKSEDSVEKQSYNSDDKNGRNYFFEA